MEPGGGFVEKPGERLIAWEPARFLRELSEEEVRYSRGFLCADPAAWFEGFAEHWSPLLHAVGVEVAIHGYEKKFTLPATLGYFSTIEVDGELAVTAMDALTTKTIVEKLAPGSSGVSAEIVLEYIERRLLSVFAKTWAGVEPLRCYYLRRGMHGQLEVAGALGIQLGVEETACTVWFGFGPRLLEKLDRAWRENVVLRSSQQGVDVLDDRIHSVSVEIAELAVPPAVLIDYMRSGAVIDLQVPFSSNVAIRVDGERWAEGELCQFKGSLAVVINSTHPVRRKLPEGTTRVRAEIAYTELDPEGLLEHEQEGAVLLTRVPVMANASIIVSGEYVASGVVGRVDGNYALSVIAK